MDNTSDAFFQQYIDQAERDLPQLKGRLVILDVESGHHFGNVDPQKAGFSSQEEWRAFLEEHRKHSQCAQSACAHKDDLLDVSGYHVDLICYTPFAFGGFPEEELPTVILDHELGHLIVPDGMHVNNSLSSENFIECAADIFACLKHLQRHANDDVLPSLRPQAVFRAIHFIFGGGITHFTSSAIEALDRIKDKIDFSILTPEQMTQLAWRLAAEHAPNEHRMVHLNETFLRFRKTLLSQENIVQKLADFLCTPEVTHTSFQAGYGVISAFLDGAVYLGGGRPDDHKDYWDKMRKTLKEKELRFESEGTLAGIPLKRETSNVAKPPAPDTP